MTRAFLLMAFLAALGGELRAAASLTYDWVANRAEVVVNGRVRAVLPSEEKLPDDYPLREPASATAVAEIDVLANFKGTAPERIRVVYPVYKGSSTTPRLEAGNRYAFLLMADGERYTFASPHALTYSAIPLPEDQPDTAPLLFDYAIQGLARKKFSQHRPDEHYATTQAWLLGDRWRVSFPTYLSFSAEPDSLSGELYYSLSGKFLTGWIGAEEQQISAQASDVGQMVRVAIRSTGRSDSTDALFGRVETTDDETLSGDFISIDGKQQKSTLRKADIHSIQRLVLSPTRPPP